MLYFALLPLTLSLACLDESKDNDDDTDTDTQTDTEVDSDGDGFNSDEDCDDENADINPDAEETCDEIDNNCNDEIDEGVTATWYADSDGDGFGAGDGVDSCGGEGWTENMDDCDDDSADINPDATEVCDEIDNDCDAMIDDADDNTDYTDGYAYYTDADGDGFGDSASAAWTCTMDDTAMANGDDCDDTDELVNPNAEETYYDGVDQNCDGLSDNDADMDGADSSAYGGDDCDDWNAMTYVGSAELDDATVCMTDEDDDGYGDTAPNCVLLYMADSYGDSWNSGAYLGFSLDGVLLGGAAMDGTEADDEIWYEICFDTGQLTVDYVAGTSYNYENYFQIWDTNGNMLVSAGGDVNGDGTINSDDGGPEAGEVLVYDLLISAGNDCDDADELIGMTDDDGDGFVACVDDCDDTDATVTPTDDDGDGFSECDADMPDCDDTDANVYPGIDADEDGYDICDDCDDGNADINPGAEETPYDGVDQNCDEMSDNDADMDGHDSDAYGGDDCDDMDWAVHPGLTGEADPTICYEDEDGDGFGSETPSNVLATAGTDCEDGSDDTYPGAAFNESTTACMRDNDGDGWGNNYDSSWYNYEVGTDCDDYDEFTYPGAAELDSTTICMTDADEDGYGTDTVSSWQDDIFAGTDCNDSDPDVSPGADADADGIDSCTDCDDADATVSGEFEAYMDWDGDGYGDDSDPMMVCSYDSDDDGVDDLLAVGGDCDDSDDTVWTGLDNDGDSVDACDDCDDSDVSVGMPMTAYWDADMDGYGAGDSYELCSLDSDGDGMDDYSTMDGDCDDSDEYTYPGAAYYDSTTECLTDWDGDGYGASLGCVILEMNDSYGDGWTHWSGNYAYVDFYLDGFLYSSYTLAAGYTETVSACFPAGSLDVGYTEPGGYNSEISFVLYDESSTELYSSGTSPSEIDPSAGDTPHYSTTIAVTGSGTDSDDSDSSVH
jgi:hypothetical protein